MLHSNAGSGSFTVYQPEVGPQHLKPSFPSLCFQTSTQNPPGQDYKADQCLWLQVTTTFLGDYLLM